MLCHWRYVLDNLFGAVERVFCLGANHIPERFDERGARYVADAEDAAYAVFELAGGGVAQINSSGARVRRRPPGVPGRRHLRLRARRPDQVLGAAARATPRPWNPDAGIVRDFRADWQEVPDNQTWPNAFRAQWELFLRHVCGAGAFPWNLLEGAKGVQLAGSATAAGPSAACSTCRRSGPERCRAISARYPDARAGGVSRNPIAGPSVSHRCGRVDLEQPARVGHRMVRAERQRGAV